MNESAACVPGMHAKALVYAACACMLHVCARLTWLLFLLHHYNVNKAFVGGCAAGIGADRSPPTFSSDKQPWQPSGKSEPPDRSQSSITPTHEGFKGI